ncbi:hypothetical protein DF048_05365 [Burkholderia seminalis]|nr:hypothetical protein DF048_05365 [Burkholderia seminalis]
MNKRSFLMRKNTTLPRSKQHLLDEACPAFGRATRRFDARPVRVPTPRARAVTASGKCQRTYRARSP